MARIILRASIGIAKSITRWREARVCPSNKKDTILCRHGGHYFATHCMAGVVGYNIGNMMWRLTHHCRYDPDVCTCFIMFWVPGPPEGYDILNFKPGRAGSLVIGTFEKDDIHFTWVYIENQKHFLRRGIFIQESEIIGRRQPGRYALLEE